MSISSRVQLVAIAAKIYNGDGNAPLDLDISSPPTQAEVQARAAKLDELMTTIQSV